MHTQLNKPWSNTIPMLAHTHNIIISSHGCTSTHRHSRMVTRYACNRIIQHNININLNSFLTYANLRTPTKMQLGHYFIRMCHKLHNIGKFLIDKQPLQTLSVTILWHVSQDAFLFLFSQNQSFPKLQIPFPTHNQSPITWFRKSRLCSTSRLHCLALSPLISKQTHSHIKGVWTNKRHTTPQWHSYCTPSPWGMQKIK